MKLIHLGDLHLGKTLGEYDLAEDQKFILDRVIELIKREKVDAVLIAGDVYDKSIPSESATNLLNDFMVNLKGSGAKTFIISGNHDSDDRLNYGSSLFELNNIYISSVFKGCMQKQTLSDDNGEIDIYMLPFVKASQVRRFYPDADISTYDDAVRTVIKNTTIDKNKRNVLIAHQFVAGKTKDPELGGSEGIGTMSVGLVEKIGCDCFDDFDYVALGHIHSPQSVGREEVRYSGSILKYSLSEINNRKSVPLVTITKKGEVQIELVELKPKRDMRHIKGKLKDLLDARNVTDTDDYMHVTLTDEEVINDAMGIVRETYPRCVKIDYDNSHSHEIENANISDFNIQKPFEETISEFYKSMYGTDISEEEMAVMIAVAKDAGVINET